MDEVASAAEGTMVEMGVGVMVTKAKVGLARGKAEAGLKTGSVGKERLEPSVSLMKPHRVSDLR